jgi:nitroreductase
MIMEFKEVVEKRRTIRDFQKKIVPENIIKYAIENGFKAPSYNHLREWDFIIINSQELKLKLIEAEQLEKSIDVKRLESKLKNENALMKEMYMDAIPKQKNMILDAPSLVIVVFKPKTKVEDAKRIFDLNCLASVWACIENFLLSLAENDVFGVTYVPKNTESIKKKMGIPDSLEIAAIVPFGYQTENVRMLKQEKINVSERIHHEKW